VTPRLWRDLESNGRRLSDSAKAVREEAERRVAAVKEMVTQGKEVVSGDRILVIGYDTDHDKHTYSGLPSECFVYPGDVVTMIDGVDCTGRFEAFLHAPFRDHCAGERNETSIAMQVSLIDGSGTGQVLLFGDLSHDTIMKIVEITTGNQHADRLAWDVLLAPHHCSKFVMYVDDELQQDVLDALEDAAEPAGCVVSSSHPIPDTDEPTANPPHRKAADRYAEIAAFHCTMEHGSTDAPTPIVFEVDTSGMRLLEPELVEASARSVEKAFTAAPSRLGLVAAAAARYAQEKSAASPAWRRTRTRTPGADRIGQAIIRDRGGQAAPSTPIGFGAR